MLGWRPPGKTGLCKSSLENPMVIWPSKSSLQDGSTWLLLFLPNGDTMLLTTSFFPFRFYPHKQPWEAGLAKMATSPRRPSKLPWNSGDSNWVSRYTDSRHAAKEICRFGDGGGQTHASNCVEFCSPPMCCCRRPAPPCTPERDGLLFQAVGVSLCFGVTQSFPSISSFVVFLCNRGSPRAGPVLTSL